MPATGSLRRRCRASAAPCRRMTSARSEGGGFDDEAGSRAQAELKPDSRLSFLSEYLDGRNDFIASGLFPPIELRAKEAPTSSRDTARVAVGRRSHAAAGNGPPCIAQPATRRDGRGDSVDPECADYEPTTTRRLRRGAFSNGCVSPPNRWLLSNVSALADLDLFCAENAREAADLPIRECGPELPRPRSDGDRELVVLPVARKRGRATSEAARRRRCRLIDRHRCEPSPGRRRRRIKEPWCALGRDVHGDRRCRDVVGLRRKGAACGWIVRCRQSRRDSKSNC